MPITELRISGYRSIRDLYLPLGNLNVITGANGCGKSNLYKAMYLLHAASIGRLAWTLAEEGGIPSVLWAGPRSKGPVRLTLGADLSGGLQYELTSGLLEVKDDTTAFQLDPVIKSETITFQNRGTRSILLDRGKSGAMLRDSNGAKVSFPLSLARSESIFTQIAEPERFPQLLAVRRELAHWRFYHGFRTDESAPLRQPQIGVQTPILAHDGRDLAAALQTILEIGDEAGLLRAVRQGLDGAILQIEAPDTRFRVMLQMPGILRPLEAWELSDGMLRYLCLLAALLSPRPAGVLALNEPENSLHPDLLEPLAAQIVDASTRSQIWVTTHSIPLARAIERLSGVRPMLLKKVEGETVLSS